MSNADGERLEDVVVQVVQRLSGFGTKYKVEGGNISAEYEF